MIRPTHTVHQGGFMGIGGEDVQVPDPLTLGEVLAQLPEGAQVFQVTTTSNGKPVSNKAVDPAQVLQPGDAIEIVNADGRHFLTHVNANASDIGDVTPTTAGGKTAPTLTLPTEGTPLERQTNIRDQTLSRYNDPNTPESEKAGLLSLLHSTETQIASLTKDQQAASGKGADADANYAEAKAAIAAGDFSKASPAAKAEYFKRSVGNAPGQPSQYAMPIPGYTGQIGPHHAGNENGAVDLFAPPGTPIVAAAGGTVVRAGQFGAAGNDIYIQGNDGRTYDYEHTDGLQVKAGDKVAAGQPLGVVATLENGGSSVGPATHLHFAVGNTTNSIDYNNHGTSTDFDTLGFVKGLASGQQSGGVPNPYATAVKPEHITLGDKVYRANPDGTYSVVIDASGMTAPAHFGYESGGRHVEMMWDPTTKQFKQAFTGDLSPTEQNAQQGKVATLLQQAQSTKTFIQQQLASGAITPQQADQYMSYLNDYTGAALQGTTPFDRYKQQQTDDIQRQQVAKDLLDTKLAQTTTMATSLLGDSLKGVTDSKYGIMAPGTLSGIFQGALDTANQQAQPLSNLAQQLLATVSQHAQAAGLDPRIPGTPPPGTPPAGMPALPIGPDATQPPLQAAA